MKNKNIILKSINLAGYLEVIVKFSQIIAKIKIIKEEETIVKKEIIESSEHAN
jgi:hypothetical protein